MNDPEGPKLVWVARNEQPGPIDFFIWWEESGTSSFNFVVPAEVFHLVLQPQE